MSNALFRSCYLYVALALASTGDAWSHTVIVMDGDIATTQALPLEAVIRTTEQPIVVRIDEHFLLSVDKGSEFRIDSLSPDEIKLLMGRGNATLSNLNGGELQRITAGSWVLNSSSPTKYAAAPSAPPDNAEAYRQNYHFDDYIYLRQQAYLESIKIPLSTFTNAVISILGGRR